MDTKSPGLVIESNPTLWSGLALAGIADSTVSEKLVKQLMADPGRIFQR
jgi:hypothetical protein